jgi:UDP-N-acetylglucosamine pyrophosphorylase
MMEVTARTAADRKGGHLARKCSDGRLMLREGAQCPPAEAELFQDIGRHRYFNTNNLWIQVDHLVAALRQHGGALPLPLIKNRKPVDPRDPASPRVLQLETAMGAAIECFEHSGAIVVSRERFSPVKTTGDLLALRSDAYAVTEDGRLALAAARNGQPPVVDLEAKHYQLLSDFERAFPQGAPSLLECHRLKVQGPLVFAAGVRCAGEVAFINRDPAAKIIPAGAYRDTQVVV